MGSKKNQLILVSLTALSLAACAPAKHSTTMMSNGAVGGLTSIFPEAGEDFEFPDADEQEMEAGNEDPLPEPIVPSNSEGRKPAAWDGHTPNAAKFTEITERALSTLGAQMLEAVPSDIVAFCPKYAELDIEGRKGVWLMLISAITKFESSFRPVLSFRENFKNAKGEFVVSRGLLQISSESANGFGCRIRQEADLQDPEVNLSCGVRILARTVLKDGVITKHAEEHWLGGARYWSVLRKDRTLPTIKGATRGLASCT